MKFLNDCAPGLQFLLLSIVAIVGLAKYFYEQSKRRQMHNRELAIESLVNRGFLVVGAEIEAIGHRAVLAWHTMCQMREGPSFSTDLRLLRDSLLSDDVCKRLLYGGHDRFSEALSRISVLHMSLYYVFINSYEETGRLLKSLILSLETELTKAQESAWKFANQYYTFARAISVKAAEILLDDENLKFNTITVTRNPRFVQLTEVCEEFKAKHKAMVDAIRDEKDIAVVEPELNKFNDYLIAKIENPDGIKGI